MILVLSYGSGTNPSGLPVVTNLILKIILQGKFYHPTLQMRKPGLNK